LVPVQVTPYTEHWVMDHRPPGDRRLRLEAGANFDTCAEWLPSPWQDGVDDRCQVCSICSTILAVWI
jgi:hypothetical protein